LGNSELKAEQRVTQSQVVMKDCNRVELEVWNFSDLWRGERAVRAKTTHPTGVGRV
jgi:hypothetical protein